MRLVVHNWIGPRRASDETQFSESKHPRDPSGKFGAGGGGGGAPSAKLAAHAAQAKEWLKGKSAGDVIAGVLANAKVKSVAKGALIIGINSLISQAAHLQGSFNTIDPQTEDFVAHTVENFSLASAVSIDQAKTLMRSSIRALIAARKTGATDAGSSADIDGVLGLLEAALEMLGKGGAAGEAPFVEAEHPRDPDGKFGSGGGSAGKSPASASHQSTKVEGGKRVTANGGPLPAHIQALKIPPAWTDVTYSADPKASLLATGKDSKGRRQAVYSGEFSAKQAAAKFARIAELDNKFTAISAQNEEARRSPDAKKRAAADCAHLIMTTGIRPGSEDDTGAEKKAYGATTLEGKHVVVDDDGKVSLKFVGKKGVDLDIPVTDPTTVKMLRERKAAAGDDGQLFPINEKALLDHVHSLDGGSFKTKDFRTLLGTRTAMDEIAKRKVPANAKEYKKAVLEVAKTVSTKLGNTPTIALQAYINPAVFAQWRSVA